jgi:A/G-specific adenine glycosylase
MEKDIKLSPSEIRRFRRLIYDHYRKNKRQLPWRETRDPYKILLSELMLQQTQVKRVREKYDLFLRLFPDIAAVAQAPLQAVLQSWQGLGYNRRALALKNLAQIVMERHRGKIPKETEALRALPGVGPATAGAILAFAFNQPSVFIETNIRSVFIHHFFSDTQGVTDREITPLIAQTLDNKKPREWYYALMDYGVALKEQHTNPSRKSAHYTRQSPFDGSLRQVRGKILKALLAQPGLTETALIKECQRERQVVSKVIKQLRAEGFITKKRSRFFIAEK